MLLSFVASPLAHGDDSTPVAPTSPPVVATEAAPTEAPVSTPIPVATEVPVIPTVSVNQDTGPGAVVTNPPVLQPTEVPTSPVQVDQGPPTAPPAHDSQPVIVTSPPQVDVTVPPSATPGHEGNSGQSSGVTLSPQPTGQAASPPNLTTAQDQSGQPSSSSIVQLSSSSSSYQAPAQLSCQGKPKSVSGPFMVSPYAGWADMNSFFDHDQPDYAVDGTITIGNGIEATSADGAASDFFPAYWSPQLRQYVNYDGHNGYDFGISYQPVLAAAAGTVSYAGWNGTSQYAGYGQMILIDHHNGYVTLYGHLSELKVKQGDQVEAGQEIAISGNTGNSSGPHLHFSVFHNCQATDPYGWTGKQSDPLVDFNGEQASYLWLPGHDPLVLNPPPQWPAFPMALTIKIPETRSVRRAIHTKRFVPPADRLLLLQLPEPDSNKAFTPPVAAARTEAQVTQEAETLVPYLQELESQGLITTYQYIPATAAIWIRGIASAAQLESLPGVASLSGVLPRDLVAAQNGLAHSILLQVGTEQAPSLWPMGFHSAQHAWRPTMSVSNGDATLTGFALPGERVTATLQRGTTVPGVASTTTDPQTGGFVVMLHDSQGNTQITRPGDLVTIGMGNRRLSIGVPKLQVQARSHLVRGTASHGDALQITMIDPSGRTIEHHLLPVAGDGRFQIQPKTPLEAGTQVVVTTVDAGGDQLFASSFVPGMLVQEQGSIVRGWTVGKHPRLTVRRGTRLLADVPVLPAANGMFQVDLQGSQSAGLTLVPGDILTLGSRLHHHTLRLPQLSVNAPLGSRNVSIFGPPSTRLEALLYASTGTVTSRNLVLSRKGAGAVPWPSGSIEVGASAAVHFVSHAGDAVLAAQHLRSIVMHESTPLVTGKVAPGTTLTFRVREANGRNVGGAVATSDFLTGRFAATLQNPAGHPVALQPGLQLSVWDGEVRDAIRIPTVRIETQGKARLQIESAQPGTTILAAGDGSNRSELRSVKIPAAGSGSILLARSWAATGSVVIATIERDGLSIVNRLSLPISLRSHAATVDVPSKGEISARPSPTPGEAAHERLPASAR